MINTDEYRKQAIRASDWIQAINEELKYSHNYNKQYILYLTKLKVEFISDIQNARNKLEIL